MWKRGWGFISNLMVVSGCRLGLCPISIMRKFRASRMNWLPLTNCMSLLMRFIISCRSISVVPSVISATACLENPSSYTLLITSHTYVKSFTQMMESSGRNESRGIRSSVCCDSSGTMVAESHLSFDNWFSTSNVRIESMSSPKKSMRNGYSQLNENTSRMLPRRANCPGS